MNLQTIFEHWEKDAKIDVTELAVESLKIPSLHHKYYKLYIGERLRQRELKKQYDVLKKEKYEFYRFGTKEDERRTGWTLPEGGKVFKENMDTYLNGDADLIEIALKLGAQDEKIEFIKSVLDTIKNRSFQIKNAVEFIKFQNGV